MGHLSQAYINDTKLSVILLFAREGFVSVHEEQQTLTEEQTTGAT